MKDLARFLLAPAVSLLVCVPARAQEQASSPPPRTSPIQRLIAVDQLVEAKEYAEAVRGYSELLAADPNNAQILNRIGNAYQALQKCAKPGPIMSAH